MDDDRPTRSSQGSFRPLRWALIVLGGLLLLVVGAAVILPLVLPSEQIEALVVPRMEAALDREVEVASAGLRVLPLPALRLYDFRVANAEGFGDEPAVEGAALDVRLELFPLFRGDVRFRSIVLDRPVIRYVVDADGQSNFEGLGGAEEAPEDTASGGALSLAAALSSVSADGASVIYDNRQSGQSAALTFDVATSVSPVPETDDIESQGTVDLRSGWTLSADAPEDTLSVRDVRLAYDLRAEPNAERLAVNQVTLDAAPFQMVASGAVSALEEAPTVNLQVKSDGIDLARLSAWQGGATTTEEGLSGTVRFALQVAGPVAQPDRLTIDGPVTLSEVQYALASLREPLSVSTAELRFAEQQLTADELPIQLGPNALTLNLTVQDLFSAFSEEDASPLPTAQFSLTSERLDLQDLYAETDEPGYVDLLMAQLAGRQIEGQDPSALAAEQYGDFGPFPVEAHGQVAIDALVTETQQIDDLSVQVDLTPQQLAVRDLTAETYDGTLAGGLSVDLQSQEPPFPAEYEFSFEDAAAEAFARQWTTLGAFLSGTLDVSLSGRSSFGGDLLPAPPTLQADGLAIATSGEFQDLALIDAILDQLPIDTEALASFDRFGGPFEIREGQLLISGWTLQTGALSGEMEGALGLNGAVTLDLTLSMPLALLRQSGLVDEIGGAPARLLGRLADEDEEVQVPVEIGGTMGTPRVRVDTDALATTLRGLLGATDTARPAPSALPDAALPDDALP